MAQQSLFGNILDAFTQQVPGLAPTKDPLEPKQQSYKESLTFLKKFAGKNVLVTGASGTIGANVTRKLLKANVEQLVLFVRQENNFDAKTKQSLSKQVAGNVNIEELDFREP